MLEVMFRKYSVPSELFTDNGMIRLTEGCGQLQQLQLKNTFLSDRSLYALAANCRDLRELQLAGYSEQISDGGLMVLAETCGELRWVRRWWWCGVVLVVWCWWCVEGWRWC
jgi:hypothetical protein